MLGGIRKRRASRREIETPRELEVKGTGVKQRLDRLQQALDTEISESMGVNIRGTAVAASSALALLLLAQFSAIWLDDNRWELLGEPLGLLPWFDLQKGLLYTSLIAFLATLALAIVTVWPRRNLSAASRERVGSLAAGKDADEAQTLLDMVEIQRASNERRGRWLRLSAVPATVAIVATALQAAIFASKAQTVDPFRAGVPSGAEALAETGLDEEEQLELAVRYAPSVVLHPDDPYPPVRPLSFIHDSRLVWNRDRRDQEIAPRGEVESERLGRLCSEVPEGCYVSPTGVLSRELTRPARDTRRGFALDFEGDVERGEPGGLADTPMFWELRVTPDELLVTYWFFYSYSRLHLQETGTSGGSGVLSRVSHEGDWENVDVALSLAEHKPLAVYFYGHGKPQRVSWEKVCKLVDDRRECDSEEPGHPIVYSALKTHASYPDPGRALLGCKIGVVCAFDLREAEGRVWETWSFDGGLLPATAQSWYGFGGAWGGVSDGAEPGPLGPSHWKLPGDPGPGDSGGP